MKMSTKKFVQPLLLIVACGLSAGIVTYLVNKNHVVENQTVVVEKSGVNPYLLGASSQNNYSAAPVDFTEAAERTVHGVVHIKSTVNSKTQIVQEMPDIFEYFFGYGQPRQREIQSRPQVGYGSGVILTADGYIVTNYHVIEGADVVEVTLNDNRIFQATVVGTDPNTDLALIKIEGDEFPYIKMGNSDNLKVGEWVLAVGNPFNLTSTVTAGVVSAKARKIGIYNGKESIESFIQTDAAINMGNSGGALVNVRGELIGINAALESPTGTYAGYGFAIPTTIVSKVVADLREFGAVQRAIMGIVGGDVAAMHQAEENKNKDYGTLDGVYVSDVTTGSGAMAAGIEKGDIIVAIDGKKVRTMTELQEIIAQHRPGDKIAVSLLRNKKSREARVELKNSQGNTEVVKERGMDILGAAFGELNSQLKRQLNIGYGLQVTGVGNGKFAAAGIQRGYIILKINNVQIKSEKDVEAVFTEAVKSPEQVLFITGIYPSGRRANFAIDLSE